MSLMPSFKPGGSLTKAANDQMIRAPRPTGRSKTPHLMTLVDVKPLKKRRPTISEMLDDPLVQLSHTTEWIVETLRKSDSNAFPIDNLNWLIGRPPY